MKNKKLWNIIFISIFWIFYIVRFSYAELLALEYGRVISLIIIASFMIIITIVINKITYNKYFGVSFLSLIIYSLWVINLDLTFRGYSKIPNTLSVLTPFIAVGINYGYKKIMKYEHISLFRSIGISILQGILTYSITYVSIYFGVN